MPCRRASRSHFPLIVMPQRCSVLRGIGIGDQDGCQARVFCNLMRPKSEPKKSAAFGGCDSRNNLMKGRSFPFLIRIPKFPQAGGGSPSMHFDCFLIEFNGRISRVDWSHYILHTSYQKVPSNTNGHPIFRRSTPLFE